VLQHNPRYRLLSVCGSGEMLSLQMQKIEELTLYIVDLQKQIDDLKQLKKQ